MHINLHKTFSTPHGGGGPGAGPVVLSAALAPFMPVPYVLGRRRRRAPHRACVDADEGAQPFGRLCAFHGQMGMFVRALAYMLSHGADGMRQASEDAVLNANYVRAGLRDLMSLPFGDRACMHEVLFDDRLARRHRRDHARFRQGDDRRGLPSDDRVFPARRARRHADRADRVREQGLARPVHRRRCATSRRRRSAATRSASRRRPRFAPRRRLDETRAARQPVLRWTPAGGEGRTRPNS